MDLFAIDDSKQNKPSRDGMRPLVGVGGIHVPGDADRDLEAQLDSLCISTGFPAADEFKWSPDKKTWMRDDLRDDARTDFFLSALALAGVDRIALAVSTDSKLSRLVQLADVVTSCSVNSVAGEDKYSPRVFRDGVLPLLRQDWACRGGRGMKIHPDQRYGNLYHWLLGDAQFVRFQTWDALPSDRFSCYRESAVKA